MIYHNVNPEIQQNDIFFGVSIPVLNLCTDLHIMPNDVGYGMMEILISLNF